MDDPDIVVIGAGVAGGAFATVMARAGFSVVMLEVTREHRDVVRGELMVPWGVAEAQRLGLYELYMQGGGHHTTIFNLYDEDVDPAEALTLDLTQLPFPPPLCLGHPRMCNLLDEAAVAAGVRFLRGVRHTQVTPGSPPTISFEQDGQTQVLKPRLVVGADGRHGRTRSQIGVAEQADPVVHWITGMLVDGADDWPDHVSCLGVEGWRHFLGFPQGGGKVRLYLCVAPEDRDRFMGPDGPRNFLEAFRLKSAPGAAAFANARPASEPFCYPNNDTWTEQPFAEGVVLVGDAAGHNDPIIGQGLSIAHRDVRVVTDILKAGDGWSTPALQPYAAERAERMRRLRNIGRYVAKRDGEFTEEARARRGRVAMRLQHPEFQATQQAVLLGPDILPPEAYAEETIAALLA